MRNRDFVAEQQIPKIVNRIMMITIGSIFMLSGMTKAINIQAFSKTIGLFLNLLELDWLYRYKVILAVMICWIELSMGFISFKSTNVKVVSCIFLTIILFFTFLSLYNLLSTEGRVESCGCFGELIHFSAIGTFIKNVILAVICSCSCYLSFKYHGSNGKEAILCKRHIITAFIFAMSLPMSSLYFLERVSNSIYITIYISLCIIFVGGILLINIRPYFRRNAERQ